MESSKKLGPGVKRVLSAPGQPTSDPLNVLIRTRGEIGPEQRAQLVDAGCQVRTVAGDVISASVPGDRLSRIGSLDFVQYIEASRPLFPERGGRRG